MTLRSLALLSLVAVVALSGCGGGDAPETEMVTAADGETLVETGGRYAEAAIDPLGENEINGSAIFSDNGSEISLQLDVVKAPAGPLAAHIHEFGDCSAADGSSAGGHWNPEGMDHGEWGGEAFHLGDLGNIEVDDSGFGSLTLVTDRWSMGTGDADDIVGHAIIVHEKGDDFTTQPTGAAGGRIACGVIVAK